MNILFLVKFYQPFDRGGSEWSTHDLAKLMVKKGHQVTILTPNYGAKSHQVIEGIKILRFPFIKRLKNPKDQMTPFWTNNIIWLIYTSLYCTLVTYKEKADLIHIHSNEFIPAGFVSSKILRKSTVATFRDYQVLCNLGFCLWHKDRACNLWDFVTKDFPFFYQNYVSHKNPIKFWVLFAMSIRARLMQKIIYFFAKKIDHKVAVSQKVREIFEKNGIINLKIINNPVLVVNKIPENYTQKIIYIGRLSPGKGIDILFKTIPEIISKVKRVSFEIIGSGYLLDTLKAYAKNNNLDQKINFIGQIEHREVLKRVSKSALVVVPSTWPEPLPRSAIEAILSGIPVVATNVGGISEIIRNNLYGILSQPSIESLTKSILEALKKNETLRKNIKRDLKHLRKRFSTDILKSYEAIYRKT